MSERSDLMRKRLFNQFKNNEPLIQLMMFFIEYVDETDEILADLALRRHKDTAEGVWLDDIADIIGIFTRPPEQINADDMFTYRSIYDTDDAIDPLLGYGSTSDPAIGGQYRSLYGNPSGGIANDADFLDMINAKIGANNAGASIPDIWDYIYIGFGAETIITTGVGWVDVELKNQEPYLSDYQRKLLVDFAPVQQGVRIRIANWQNKP